MENEVIGGDLLAITLKYGGNWKDVKNEARKKYFGGRQKTIKVQRTCINFEGLKGEIEMICPWLRGYDFDIHHHIHGTSPKEYRKVSDEDIFQVFMGDCSNCNQCEIVVSTNNDIEENPSMVNSNTTGQSSATDIIQLCEDVLCLGAKFSDAKSFKQALRSEAIRKNFGVQISASDKTRVIASCNHTGCPWRIRASVCADGQAFQIRKVGGAHACPGINRAGNKMATSEWVGNEIKDIVKRQPEIPPKQIKERLESSYGLSLPYMKLWRSRELAKENIFGTIEDNYKWIPALHCELTRRNPGSHIRYLTESPDNSFKRFFVSFKVCMDGFIAGCRPLIGLDACHLKSKYLGVLISANSLDGNNGLYTLAFAIVEGESKSSWQWFLQNLSDAIGFEMYPLAFISDMEKGLESAMKSVFPNAEHRVCLRNLWKNLRKQFRCEEGFKIHSLIWSAANTYLVKNLQRKLNEIFEMSPEVHSYLISLPFLWSKAQFNELIRNDTNTNNLSESFNAWVSEARYKPAVDLIDTLRGMIMDQRATRYATSLSWRSHLVPHADEYIRHITSRKDQFVMRSYSPFRCELEGAEERQEVDIQLSECSCRQWQMTGLPCIHAVAFIGSQHEPL